jgi:AraC family transcriptional regulator, regulatory protein of adaptative response / methylated-DNA-[protein]-cysteine methyltransferase
MKEENSRFTRASEDYRRIAKVLDYLEAHAREKPSFDRLARLVNLSSFHFHRLFKRWVGLSPKQFLDSLTLERAKALLERSRPVLDVSLDVGLSGPGRLHDLFVKVEAMTPGEYKRQGCALEIAYGFHQTPFGECLIAMTSRGVCGLSFVDASARKEQVENLRRRWPLAVLKNDPAKTGSFLTRVFGSKSSRKKNQLSVFLKGTPFQLKVWEALLHIPPGTAVSYEDIARWIHSPKAWRAVASAVGENPIAYVIPCHRVVRKLGHWGGYRWGLSRKKAMRAWEAEHGSMVEKE